MQYFLRQISRITFKRFAFSCCNLNLQFRQFFIFLINFVLLFLSSSYNWNSYKRKSFLVRLSKVRFILCCSTFASLFFVRILFWLSTGSWIIISIHCLACCNFLLVLRAILNFKIVKTFEQKPWIRMCFATSLKLVARTKLLGRKQRTLKMCTNHLLSCKFLRFNFQSLSSNRSFSTAFLWSLQGSGDYNKKQKLSLTLNFQN